MAISESFEVSILVDGKALTEHELPAHEAQLYNNIIQGPSKTILKLVEVKNDQRFSVRYRVRSGHQFSTQNLIFFLQFDEAHVDGVRLDMPGQQCVTSHVKVMKGHSVIKRPFKFCLLKTTDESLNKEAISNISRGIGTIKIDIWMGGSSKPVEPFIAGPSSMVGIDSVPEKAIKGRPIVLRASLGDSELASPLLCTSSASTIGEQPLTRFVHVCRSKRALELMDVIPEAPQPINAAARRHYPGPTHYSMKYSNPPNPGAYPSKTEIAFARSNKRKKIDHVVDDEVEVVASRKVGSDKESTAFVDNFLVSIESRLEDTVGGPLPQDRRSSTVRGDRMNDRDQSTTIPINTQVNGSSALRTSRSSTIRPNTATPQEESTEDTL